MLSYDILWHKKHTVAISLKRFKSKEIYAIAAATVLYKPTKNAVAISLKRLKSNEIYAKTAKFKIVQ